MNKNNTKTRTENFHQLPPKLWKKFKKQLPKGRKGVGPGRPRVNNRNVIDGIW